MKLERKLPVEIQSQQTFHLHAMLEDLSSIKGHCRMELLLYASLELFVSALPTKGDEFIECTSIQKKMLETLNTDCFLSMIDPQ
ncbi:hypothetical protein QR680_001973 [Steinernema hermaphroditum]|uniref:Uncharacterized protein n=1 Tax=Steinernema hermaphroditum TaxID=289476 RepID=A0AA39LH51_9BILA|nr:hypothetical protein QR680_001973 [Steinernema hermaphroditum]